MSATRRPKMRDRWTAVAGLATAVVLIVLAFVVGTPAAASAGPSESTAICDAASVAPFGCRIVTVGGRSAWFDTRRDPTVLVLDDYGSAVLVPVVIDGGTGRTSPVIIDAPTIAECAGDPSCRTSAVEAEFYAHSVTLTPDADGFVLRSGSETRLAHRTTASPQYLPVVARGTRFGTLLTSTERNGNQASIGGSLGENVHGCITVGGTVLILPPSAQVRHDGSIVLDGKVQEPGRIATFGGSLTPIPPDTWRCGAGERYWWAY